MGINPCPLVYLMDLMANNNRVLTQVHQMEDDKWASTHVHRARPIRPDGEQQLSINPGSSDGGQQMGINPCPLSSPTTPNRGQQLDINPGSLDGGQQMRINSCLYTMEDNKWELTHVHQTHSIRNM